MTQFAFLQAEFAPIFSHAKRAEQLALSDPRGACFYARLALETAVNWLYESDRTLRTPYQSTLSALIHEPTFRQLVGNALVTKAKIIKDLGNRAVHDARPVAEQSSTTAVRELFHFSYWLVRTFGRGVKPEAGIQFDGGKLEKTLTISASTVQQIKKLREDFDAREKALEFEKQARLKTEADRDKLEAEIKRLQAEIAEVKKANEAAPDTHDYNEAETRDAFIDLLLHEAGWPLDQERDREYPVTGMPNTTGEGFVDYVLWGGDGKPLAVVEAKRTRKDAQVARQEAELHAPETDDYDAGAEPLADHIAGLKAILERELTDLGIESLPSEKDAEQAQISAQESAQEARDTQATARAALGGPEEEMGRIQAELGSVKTRYDDGKERLDKLKKGLAEAEEQVSDDDLEANVTTARKALADQEKAVSELEGQREGETLPQLEARISRLETALQERRDKRSDLKEKVVGLQSHIEALEGAGLDEAIQQKEREVELAEDQRQRYEREVTVLTLIARHRQLPI